MPPVDPQAQPAAEATGELISPYDQRIYAVPTSRHAEYQAQGWVAPVKDFNDAEVHSHISNWREMGGAESMVYSASAGWLGLPKAITAFDHAVGHDDWAKNYADSVIMAGQQHPTLDTIARLGTGIGSAALYTAGAVAAAPAVLGAVGLGGAAALGAEAAGAGAVTEGVLAAGTAAAEGVAGAGEIASLTNRALSAAPAVGKLAARFAGEGAAIGIVDRYDQAAIQHASSPEGQEKVVWGFADIGADMALNAGAGLALTGAAKAIGSLGRSWMDGSTNKLVDALLKKNSMEQAALAGRDGELRDIAKTIVPMGIERGRVFVDSMIDVAEKDMNQLKFEIEGKGNFLKNNEVQNLKKLVDEQLAGTVEGKNILKLIEDAAGETDRAKTFAPGEMARRADEKVHLESKAAHEKYVSDYDAEYKQRLKGHQGTKAYAEHIEKVKGEQARLNAEADAQFADATKIYESQQASFNTASGGRMSPGEYRAKFGRDVPDFYHEPAPVRRGPKTANVGYEPVVKEMPFTPPKIEPMQSGERYAAMDDAYFDSMRKGDPDKVLNPQAMQGIRKEVYNMINFPNYGARPQDEKLRQVGRIFGDQIKQIFERADTSAGKQYAAKWAQTDANYSAASLLKAALRTGGDSLTWSGLIDKVVSAGAIGAVVGSTGFMGGAVNAAKTSASFKAIQSMTPQMFHRFGSAMGGVMAQADKKIANVVVQRLRNTPVVLRNQFSPAKYEAMAAKYSQIGANPTQAATNVYQGLTNLGVPHDVAEAHTGPIHAGNMFIADQLKFTTGPADMPSRGHGDPQKLRKIMAQAHAIAHPDEAIAHPTTHTMEVVKKFYPNTLMAAQAAIYAQIRKNPRMSPAAKQWASRVLGRPINNLSSPGFSAMLQQSRAASQKAAAQAGGPSKGASRSSKGEDTGSQTRLDELQNGG